MKRISVVYSYRSNDQLLCTVDEMIRYGMEVVVVDDGSGEPYDSFYARLREYGAEVLCLPMSLGKDEALKAGICKILERENDECTLVTMDGTNPSATRDIFRVCIEAELNPGAIALGCRAKEKVARFTRRLGDTLTRLVVRLRSGIKVLDIQSALCAFSAQVAARIVSLTGCPTAYEQAVLTVAAKAKIPLHELIIGPEDSLENASDRKGTRMQYLQTVKQQ